MFHLFVCFILQKQKKSCINKKNSVLGVNIPCYICDKILNIFETTWSGAHWPHLMLKSTRTVTEGFKKRLQKCPQKGGKRQVNIFWKYLATKYIKSLMFAINMFQHFFWTNVSVTFHNFLCVLVHNLKFYFYKNIHNNLWFFIRNFTHLKKINFIVFSGPMWSRRHNMIW